MPVSAVDEMLAEVPVAETDPLAEPWAEATIPPKPLVVLSVEKNSRGYTWKVEVGETGVEPDEALRTLDYVTAQMGSRFGLPSPNAKE